MKKLFILTALILCISQGAFAAPLFTTTHEEMVTAGVTLKNEKRFYGEYALDINLITADLKNEYLGFELLKNSGGVDKTTTVANLAKENEETVVAINGDFFSAYKGTQNFSLGLEVKEGALLQSHINSDMAAGFFGEGSLLFSYVDFKAQLIFPDKEAAPIAHVNKPTDYYGALLMYTPEFNGGESPFLPEGITAVTVTDGKVVSKGVSLGGTIPIPENSYILVIDDNMSPTLNHKVNIDDILETEIVTTPPLEKAQTAFGGGSMLIKDGEKTPVTHNVSGNNPRSVIGTNADGTVIYMMTVDGRKTTSRGVSLDALADICIEMGMVNALNLDGGGSTALVGKTLENDTLHTINTPTENRKVINALAITSDASPDVAIGLFAKADRKIVLAGDGVALSYTAYDENYNTPKSVNGRVEWKVPSGRGYVKDNVYYPKKEGEVTLDLYYSGKKTDSVSIYVIDSIAGIIAPKEFVLETGASLSLAGKISVFDKDGNTATVNDITLLNPVYDRKMIFLQKDSVVAMEDGATNLVLSKGNAERSIKLTCGKFDIDLQDSVMDDSMRKEADGGFRFDIFAPSEVTTLYDRIVYANAMDKFKKSDVSAIVGEDKIEELTPEAPIKAGVFREESAPSSVIMSLETGGGKISRTSQWGKLNSALKGENKNVFIILDTEANFVTDLDREAFYAMIEEASESKNVFVIYAGEENFCAFKNGARFISVANARRENMLHRSIEKTCYLSFDIKNDGEVTYSFRKLFE